MKLDNFNTHNFVLLSSNDPQEFYCWYCEDCNVLAVSYTPEKATEYLSVFDDEDEHCGNRVAKEIIE